MASLLPMALPARSATEYDLLVSLSSDRADPEVLDGQTFTEDIFVFTSPDTGVNRVRFYLDDPDRLEAPTHSEGVAPYDFAGGNSNGTAKPFDPTQLAPGEHTITAELDLSDGTTTVVEGTFNVGLTASPSSLSLSVGLNGSDSTELALDTTDGAVADFDITDDADWLTVDPVSGQTPTAVTAGVDATGLALGNYTAVIDVTDPTGTQAPTQIPVTLDVTEQQVLVSLSSDRADPEVLDGQVVGQDIYVFTSPDTGVSRVRFYLDDPDRSEPPTHTEGVAPYDFAGGNSNGTAKPFDPTQLAPGEHTITAEIDLTDGTTTLVEGTFSVGSEIVSSPSSLSLSVGLDGSDSAELALDTTDGAVADFEISDDADWLTVTPVSGQTPTSVSVGADATGLTVGTHTATIDITDPTGTHVGTQVSVTLEVNGQYDLFVSLSSDRADPEVLDGQTFAEDIYVFTSPDTGVSRVRFYLDDPDRSEPPTHSEGVAPYDFAGGNSDGTALPFDPTQLSGGEHTLTAEIDLTDGTTTLVEGTFNVPASLTFTPADVSFEVDIDGSDSADVDIVANDGSSTFFTLSHDADWLSFTPGTGTTPETVTMTVDAAGLAVGTYQANVTATDSGGVYQSATMDVQLTVSAQYGLLLSLSPDRSNPEALNGQPVYGDIHVFTSPDAGVSKVAFYLDDPTQTGSPRRTETVSPFDFVGTALDESSLPYDSTQLAIGEHTVTAEITNNLGTQVVHGTFVVPPALVATPGELMFDVNLGGSASADLAFDTDNGSVVTYDVSDDADWLTVEPTTGDTPSTVTVTADGSGLTDGLYTGTITANSGDLRPATVSVEFTVGNPDCAPLSCEDILVQAPYELDFSFDGGHLPDQASVGTGFTYVDAPTNGNGHMPENLTVDLVSGNLQINTTPGLAFTSSNSLDNALAVGFDAPDQVTLISTTLSGIPETIGNYEQAGLWFGNDEDNYVKLVALSTPTGNVLQFLFESGGIAQTPVFELSGLGLTGSDVELRLRVDPSDQSVAAYYGVNGAPLALWKTITVPSEFFSFDAAGIDPRIGTRSFAGIFASHRNAPESLTYTFDDFGVVAEPTGPIVGTVSFDRQSFPVPAPTSMAWGPDGRLYVTEILGDIHAVTLNENHQVVDDQVIDAISDAEGGPRLTLGIEVDPTSTAEDVILWVAHSSGSLTNGAANSSTVTRLSGTNFGTVENVITGLPRAIANHAINSLHFGPDGRLYIAIGGNTGTGAPNDANTEFATRPEQPLSAALLVADVNAPDFEGSCASAVDDSTGTADKTIPATCDVAPFATGVRNMYDFVFHSNGEVYGPDNGLGVKGTVPGSPTPDCQGIVEYGNGELDPGPQPDPLLRLEQGKYYGHPNPARDECAFQDGSFQGVSPLANYEAPLLNLGNHKSANGIIEYTSDRRCGSMQGDLLIANFSSGDDIVRVILSDDGLGVEAADTLVGGFDDPLPLVTGPDGTIYVGEMGANRVTALIPTDIGCWESRQSMPEELLDMGGAALNGNLYVVGGKTTAGPQSSVYVYNPTTDSWSSAADLPGQAVENPAVMAGSDGRLYAFGGSTDPFSGAVDSAAAYDPVTDSWSTLAPMPTPRGGATAQELNGLIYVVGGMGSDGASVDLVEIYNPATNSWSTAPSMSTRRDNPGSAILDGQLYIFGGRTRDADGTEVNGTLSSVEAFDPSTETWSLRAPMPTGRRTFAVGVLNGRALVMGGEKTPAGGTFEQNEEYDPATDTWRVLEPMLTPRHGVAAGTIDGAIFVAGGGPQGGSSFSGILEVFRFESE